MRRAMVWILAGVLALALLAMAVLRVPKVQEAIVRAAVDFSQEAGRIEAVAIPGPADAAGPAVVLDEDALRITAFAVHHDPVKPATATARTAAVREGDWVLADHGFLVRLPVHSSEVRTRMLR